MIVAVSIMILTGVRLACLCVIGSAAAREASLERRCRGREVEEHHDQVVPEPVSV